MNFVLHNPTKLYFGIDKLENLKYEIKDSSKVLVTYGGGSIKKIGLYDQVIEILRNLNCKIYELSGIEPNPKLSSVNEGIQICKKHNIDFILAIGGGSVIDASKAISVGSRSDNGVWDIIMKKVEPTDNVPLGVILTLSATGTEMNPNSVITNDVTKQKVGFAHRPYTSPVFSILDPTYTVTVPKNQTVNGIADTISHLLEQYFNLSDNSELLDRFCESSIEYMMEITPKLLDDLENVDLREAMMYTSFIALNGNLSIGGGDWATHEIEHSVSGIFDIPHGEGLAILTPNWIKYVSRKNPSKIVKLGERVFKLKRDDFDDTLQFCDEVSKRFRQFFDEIGAPSSLGDRNISLESLDELVENTFVLDDTVGEYVKLFREDVREILKMSM